MSAPGGEFGSATVTRRELRNLLIWSSATVALLLLFGVGLAIRLRTPEMSARTSGPESEATMTELNETAELPSPDEPVVLAPTRDTQPILPSTGTPGPLRFGVRVGIFSVPENADGMLLRLQSEGYAPFVVFHRLPERTLRYVYAGVSPTEEDATLLAARLKDTLGLNTHIEQVEPVR